MRTSPPARDAGRAAAAAARLQELAQAGELDDLLRRLDVELLTLHGSAAETEPLRPPADVDVAVLHGPQGDLLATIGALVTLLELDEVDVMDLRRAGPVARAQALGPGCVPLYESRSGLYAEHQMRALTERMETAWLRRLDLELLAQPRIEGGRTD